MRIILTAALSLSLCLAAGCVGGSAHADNRGARGDLRMSRSF